MDSKPDPMPSAPVMAQAVQAVLVEPDGYQAVPPATPQQSLKFPPTPIVGVHQMEHLYAEHKMTPGLCNAVVRTLNDFAVRIWVVDNSGSMATGDGNRIVTTSSGATKVVSCSRWDEIVDCVNYHASLARDTLAPTKFRMLNPTSLSGKWMPMGLPAAGQSTVAYGGDFTQGYQQVYQVMKRSGPGGVTPLSKHIAEIRTEVEFMRDDLDREGKKVCIVLATDGLPSDCQGYSNQHALDEFTRQLRSLVGLPIWVVVRLCTDEDDVTDFYNELDNQVELNFEVIDDFQGEAKEVYACNPWLNYGLPLHKIREWGYSDRILDMLDERKLMVGEVVQFVSFLFGVEVWDVPDPAVDFKEFLGFVNDQNKSTRPVFNVIKKQQLPWIDVKKLASMYSKGEGCSVM